jgi:hypothetical protein
MADSAYPYQTEHSRTWDRDRDGRNDRLEDRAYDRRFDRDRDGRNDRLEDRAYDQRFGHDQGGFSGGGYSARQYGQWYPGWRHSWYENRDILSPHRLIRRVERQGFYGVRTFGFSRRGMIRATAFDQWRRPVQLRVDPYTGAVLLVMPA